MKNFSLIIFAFLQYVVALLALSTKHQYTLGTNTLKGTKLLDILQKSREIGKDSRPYISAQLDSNGMWKNGTDNDGGLLFYSSNGGTASFKCQSFYPLRWNILSGHLTHSEEPIGGGDVNWMYVRRPAIIKMSGKREFSNDGTLNFAITLRVLNISLITNASAAIKVACEEVGNPTKYSTLSIFLPGNQTNLESWTDYVINSNLIPCFTRNPFSLPKLFRKAENDGEELVTKAVYDATKGFYSKSYFKGDYVCRQGTENISVKAIIDFPDNGFEVHPTSSDINVFTDEIIHIKCKSRDTGHVYIEMITADNGISVEYTNDSNISKSAIITATTEGTHWNMSTGGFKLSGKLVCGYFSLEIAIPFTIKEWNIAFYDPPKITTAGNNDTGSEGQSISCTSASQLRGMSILKCHNTFECQLKNRTFDLGNEPYLDDYSDIVYDADDPLMFDSNGTYDNLVDSEGVNLFLSGIGRCYINNTGLFRTLEFFESLSLFPYVNWKDVPEHDLINMDGMGSVQYANLSTNFTCRSLEYLFQGNVIFKLEFSNGSSIGLPESDQDAFGVKYKIKQASIPERESVRPWVLQIILPVDAVAVHCEAYFVNSTDVVVDTKRFLTKYLRVPVMENNGTDVENHFTEGDKNRRLICPAGGEPPLDYQWVVETGGHTFSNVTKIFPELIFDILPNGEGYLEFPLVSKKYAGSYQCIAGNMLGSVRKGFSLGVIDAPPVEVFIAIAVVGAVIILVALNGAMKYFKEKITDHKERYRQLTIDEVKSFFHGYLEPTNGESVDIEIMTYPELLPYKTDLEIPLDDNFKLHLARNGILGKGEFSDVLKGLMPLDKRSIAVKMPKATTDVQRFKTLLTEVKIMTFVGEHPNIVKFIGANTERIQDRCIYIVTELCERGNLAKFLRESRSNFCDLLNENHEIEYTKEQADLIVALERATLSTLDLISFAAQIASGMEHLASKRIVHADLAARNVLLTKDNVIKISDFGLSRMENQRKSKENDKDLLSWRWASPELLDETKEKIFTSKSDIWSYGITLYELFTLGDIPFPCEKWNSDFVGMIKAGMKMDCPTYCTWGIYEKMICCWQIQAERRPSFCQLKLFFQELIRSPSGRQSREDTLRTQTTRHQVPMQVSIATNPNSGYVAL